MNTRIQARIGIAARELIKDISKGFDASTNLIGIIELPTAETMLETSDAFNGLREDIRTDLTWELADHFQKEYEAFCEEQKI